MRTLRGQVAMEYLATYGWALLAMFAVLAVLVGSGMLGIGRFTSEECSFVPNLPCKSGYFTPVAGSNDQLMLYVNLTNTQGYPMLITKCDFRLVGGNEVKYADPVFIDECVRNVSQGSSFSHLVDLTSDHRVSLADMRKVYVTYSFKNCQDLTWGECDKQREEHNTSGVIVASIRG